MSPPTTPDAAPPPLGIEVDAPASSPRLVLEELIARHTPITALLLDAEGRVAAATRPRRRLTGAPHVENQPWWQVLPEPLVNAADLEEQMARAVRTGLEVSIPRVDVRLENEPRSFKISIIPVSHTRARLLVQLEDQTEIVEAERRLAEAQLSAHLAALSSAVAHELKNPLTGISAAISAIARSLDDDDQRRPVMHEVASQVRRLDDLVRDLLDFARPIAVNMGSVQLEDVVDEAVQRHPLAHAAAHIATEGAGGAWADRVLLSQILHNLLSNAFEAIGSEGEVLIQVWPGVLLVSDSGPGVPSEVSEAIFAPFFTTRTRGTGLGLAICRKAAAAMGGQITLSRGPLPGAAFRVTLNASA